MSEVIRPLTPWLLNVPIKYIFAIVIPYEKGLVLKAWLGLTAQILNAMMSERKSSLNLKFLGVKRMAVIPQVVIQIQGLVEPARGDK